jgi:DNA-directed RNA polymerase alpha subunit
MSKVNSKNNDKVIHKSVKKLEELPTKLKFALLRSGINNVSDLLKLNNQDLINIAGVGAKSREILKRICDMYNR